MFLQKVLNPFKATLVKRRFSGKQNPYESFKQIAKDDVLPEPTEGTIFVGPIKMSAVGHLFEGLVGYYFRKKGYRVFAVMCGQKLEYCENKGLSAKDNLKCSVCFGEQIEFCETFKLEPLYIGDFLTKEEESKINFASENVTLDKIDYDQVDFKSHVTSGLMRVFKISRIPNERIALLKKYAQTSFRTFQATRNMIQKYQPDHVLLSHGTYSTWGSLIEACRQENVHSIVWGRGYVGSGNIMATQNGSYLFRNSKEPISNFEDIELNPIQIEKVKAYFAGKRNLKKTVDYVNYYKNNGDISSRVDVRKELNLDPNRKIFGMFPNIPWDGQAFSYSEAFPSIREFIVSTIEWMKNQDAYLIIRAHPAEKHSQTKGQLETFQDILFELYPSLPENVIFLPADHTISSYQLEEHIEVALLYAGTLGLEFTVNGTPVVQVGNNANSSKGFIFEPGTQDEYLSMLNRGLQSELKLTEEMKRNCMKYAYHWVFRRHFPETTVEFTADRDFKSYSFKNTDELMENEVLSQFASCIENKHDFIYHNL